MKITLNGIDVECVIGERADERDRLQHLRVDVVMEIVDYAAKSDELIDTVDYAVLTERIRSVLVEAQCKMIERAALLVAETCKDSPLVRSVEAKVTKSAVVPHLESASAIYCL